MKKKRKLKKKVIVILVLLIILVLGTIGFLVYKNWPKQEASPAVVKVVDEIPEYGYTLNENAPKVYKDLFKKLIDVLKEENVDYDEYARLISQMAVIDFYNLDNKSSKNDIGGVQFIREENVDNFILEASETVYKYVEQNLDGTRKQKLPIVTSSEVKELKNEKYKYKKIQDDKAYTVKVTLDYQDDLGYPKEVTVKLLHNDKKLEIYYMK